MTNAIKLFDQAKQAYLTEQLSIGLSEETVKNYSARLKRFREFWAAGEPQDDPQPTDIRAYRDRLLADGLAKTTVKQYLIELKGFFTFTSDPEIGFYERNPVSAKMYPKITDADERIYDKILDTKDFIKLWKNERPCNYSTPYWERNYAIVTLLLDAKLRNSEVLNLKVSDMDLDYHEIEVKRGKGKKRRWVTVSDITVTAIQLYLESGIRPDYCTDDDYLFGTTAEHKYGEFNRTAEVWHKGSRQWLSALVERHIALVTGKHGFMTHSLRHNGAVLDLNTGTRTERLQAELGHSSITTTEIYSGRLQSVRKARDYQKVAEERDRCARENKEKLGISEEPEETVEDLATA